VDPDAFVAGTATLIGAVTVEAGASIWYNAVLRADRAPITVRAGANVQDGSVVHTSQDLPCEIHGATIGAGAMVANGSTVLDGATIGAGSLVAAHSLVAEGTQVPDGVLVAGSPAVVKRSIEGTPVGSMVAGVPKVYVELARRHAEGVEAIG
jgi:carbonic anhydrase/acetyltransferase-like protein (isoleucine patch superfamily)